MLTYSRAHRYGSNANTLGLAHLERSKASFREDMADEMISTGRRLVESTKFDGTSEERNAKLNYQSRSGAETTVTA